ncbi:hypothetical protein TIFTF001_039518 [Ficus carica]|uniref:Uncharacterized protein n=1 Tax=Ficus carica TaxID=3494 RepID=A0AA88JE62_FICCA|nr:hypothetical protein TIFTF001_039518 [Ficus carica]
MRLQWPRILTKPEPEVPRTPARPGPLHGPGSLHGQDGFHKNIARRSVPTGFNSTLDTAFTNEVSSLAATPDTRWRARFGPWFELDWTGRPNHSIAVRHDGFTDKEVVLIGRKLITYVYAVDKDMDPGQIEEDREASMAFWGMEPPLITLRYGPLPGEGLNMPYRGLDIYRDMYMRRYVSYIVAWSAYPNKSIGHYCQRFRDAMLPYIPLDMDRPMMQALNILRYGLPPEATPKGQAPEYKDDHPLIPVYDADTGEPVFHRGAFMPEEPIPALPIQEENSEDPPVIIITSDDEEEIEEKQEEEEEDPKEIMFNDDDE